MKIKKENLQGFKPNYQLFAGETLAGTEWRLKPDLELSNLGQKSLNFTSNSVHYNSLTITEDGVKYGAENVYWEGYQVIINLDSSSTIHVYESDTPGTSDLEHLQDGSWTLNVTVTKTYLTISCSSGSDIAIRSYTGGITEYDSGYDSTIGGSYVTYEVYGNGVIDLRYDPCFAEGTLIYLGEKEWAPIDKLSQGDKVYSYNSTNDTYQEDIIGEWVLKNGCNSLVSIGFDNGEEIKCTKQHSFLTSNGWKCIEPTEHTLDATQLSIGDRILTMDGELVVTSFKEDNETQPIYHIVLMQGDTLIVGGEKIKALAEHYRHEDFDEKTIISNLKSGLTLRGGGYDQW